MAKRNEWGAAAGGGDTGGGKPHTGVVGGGAKGVQTERNVGAMGVV